MLPSLPMYPLSVGIARDSARTTSSANRGVRSFGGCGGEGGTSMSLWTTSHSISKEWGFPA
eukprot:scaffold116485_cov39-Tisochrysis_lutea.AAC.1